MITARPQKNLKAAEAYFREHLARGDNYSQDQTIAGQWYGEGVIRLAVRRGEPVGEQAFLRLCNNLHPGTGEKLTARLRAERRVFYDFVVSAPKSVSVMAVTLGDTRLLTAHDEACAEAIAEIEKAAAARVRRANQRAYRLTGEMVAAAFRHDSSRALDPQLHTHLVVFNATFDPVENAWRALESEQMFSQARFHTEVYRNALARRLTALGYDLRTTENGFEIEGVSPSIIERFSKRRQTIAQVEDEIAKKLGHRLSNNGRATVAHSTRDRKRRDLGPGDVVALQRAQLSPQELVELQRIIPAPNRQRQSSTPGDSIAADRIVRQACDHLFERLSVVPQSKILEVALKFGRGRVDPATLQLALVNDPALLRKDGLVTTREAQMHERQLIKHVNAAIGAYPALHRGFQPNSALSEEQRQVVDAILRSTDGVVGLRGGAGTGKTTVLKEIGRGIEARGKAVQLLAPTTGAVETLREEGIRMADTVQGFLVNKQLQERSRGNVVIIDEAGLMSVRQTLEVIEACRRNDSRIILSGDARQHSSVEAGDALRILQTQSHLQTASLHRIRRQHNPEYRDAVAAVAAGNPRQGLSQLVNMKAVEELDNGIRHQKLASDFAELSKAETRALIVAPTWREIGQVTSCVRRELKHHQLLREKEIEVEVHVPLHWTSVQKRDLTSYQPGQVLTFHRGSRACRRGEWAQVVSCEKEHLLAQKPNGELVKLTIKQTGCFDVAAIRRLPVAHGERLLLQGNLRESRLLNGQLVTVKSVRADGQITLDDGRVIPPAFRRFTHGYCLTSQAVQGKSADYVLVAMDSHSGEAANMKQFYVSISRGRDSMKIYTDDLRWLQGAIVQTGDRTSALELLERGERAREAAGARIRVR